MIDATSSTTWRRRVVDNDIQRSFGSIAIDLNAFDNDQ